MSFRIFAFAGAASALLIVPLAPLVSTAAPLSTDLSSQNVPNVEVGPGGVRVGHGRYDSRRRDERDRDDRVDPRRRDRGCKTVTTREQLPGGGVKIVKRREC